jgi:DNA-binding MarR family transcriptional regulator
MAKQEEIISQKLDEVTRLLQYLVAIELYKEQVPKELIGKHLHIAKSTVVKMLKGIEKKGKKNGQKQ